MLERKEYMPLAYFKKQKWSGSYQGMRFLFERRMEEHTDSEAVGTQAEPEEVLLVTIWKEPYSYEATPEEKKQEARFAFSETGREQAIDWLEEQYALREAEFRQAMRWDWKQENG